MRGKEREKGKDGNQRGGSVKGIPTTGRSRESQEGRKKVGEKEKKKREGKGRVGRDSGEACTQRFG